VVTTSKTKWRAYAPVDIRTEGTVWPAEIPPLTAPEAVRAASKLWRFVFGVGCPRDIFVTSGNRYTGESRRGLEVNPDRGWRHFVHELSHAMWTRYAPTYRGHGADHGRFESKVAREVVKRGWLAGALKDAPSDKPAPTLADKHAAERKRIEARLTSWQRKERLAANGVARVERELVAHDRKVRAAAKRADAPKPEPKPRPPSLRQQALALAQAHGFEVEPLDGGGFNVWPPESLDDERDPHHGDHYAHDWGAALDMLREYAALLTVAA